MLYFISSIEQASSNGTHISSISPQEPVNFNSHRPQSSHIQEYQLYLVSFFNTFLFKVICRMTAAQNSTPGSVYGVPYLQTGTQSQT